MRNLLHLKAPGNWINDPNGFIYYNGEYHLFYQHFPYAPRWGTMHWGHAVSPDLVHWEHKGVALFPSLYEDRNGCFSGSAIEHEGKLHLFYTGVRYLKPNPRDVHVCLNDQFESSQLMLTSGDGYHFDNFKDKSVLLTPEDAAAVGGDMTHTRDPKVWKGKAAWYMILGSSVQKQKGEALIYKSQDLIHWSFGSSSTKEKDSGWMWECPDYFEVGGKGMMIFSPMGLMKEEKYYGDQSICAFADFDEESCTMKISEEYQLLDYGLDLYAPQSTMDARGRRVVVAWLRMEAVKGGKEPRVQDNDKAQDNAVWEGAARNALTAGMERSPQLKESEKTVTSQKPPLDWCGMFCLPRVVETENGHIYFRIHPDVDKMYSKRIASAEEASAEGYKLSLELAEGGSVNIGGFVISRRENRICTDRSAVCWESEAYRKQLSTPQIKEGSHLDIYVDEHLIEIFVNHGEYVISNGVCGLGKEISSQGAENQEIYTIQE